MGLEIVYSILAPVLANIFKGVSVWAGSKKANGEEFDFKKLIRTAVTSLTVAGIAYATGLPPDEQSFTAVSAQYAGAIALVAGIADATISKWVERKAWPWAKEIAGGGK